MKQVSRYHPLLVIALGGGRPDRRRIGHRVSRARADAQLRPSENRRSAGAHGGRNADPRPDGHPLHRPNVHLSGDGQVDRANLALDAGTPSPASPRTEIQGSSPSPAMRARGCKRYSLKALSYTANSSMHTFE